MQDGPWTDECKCSAIPEILTILSDGTVNRVHWLRAKAQFERWKEEQDSIRNEAVWVPAYFHTMAEHWKARIVMTTLRKMSDFVFFLPFLFSLYHHPEPSGTFYDNPPTSVMTHTLGPSSMT